MMNNENKPAVYRRAYRKPGAFAQKVARPDPTAAERCAIMGCGRPTERFAGKGLSVTHCRYHVQMHSRHGSYWKRSYAVAELEVCRKTVERFLRAMPKSDLHISAAIKRLENLLYWAGPDERAADVLDMKPRDKARKAFARLRAKGIPVERILARCLAVELALAEDTTAPHGDDDKFRRVQLAKQVMRLAGGHRYDKHAKESGKRYGIYLRSSGLVLRNVGRELAEAIAPALEGHVKRLLDCKAHWYRRTIPVIQTCDCVRPPKGAQTQSGTQSVCADTEASDLAALAEKAKTFDLDDAMKHAADLIAQLAPNETPTSE